MEGAARVFAGEFSRSTGSLPDPAGEGPPLVLTPGGAVCGRIFIAGAVTEIADYGAGLRCRISDPTGVFTVDCPGNGKPDVYEALKKVPVPSFIAIIGRAQVRTGTRTEPFIRPESVQIIGRPARDAWVVRTAENTLDRIHHLADALEGGAPGAAAAAVLVHYHTTKNDLQELVALVSSALSGLGPPPSAEPAPAQDAREVLVAILSEQQGPKGMPVEGLFAEAVLRGLPKERAEAALAEMIREDDCYQPQKGSVRLL